MDATIPEPGGPLLCGQVVSGQAICGQDRVADDWVSFPMQMLSTTAEVIVPIDLTIVIEDTGYLTLFGGVAHVNPVLMPFACLDLDLALVTCTPLDLALVAPEDLDLAASARAPLDLVPLVTEEIDLDVLVCLEA